MKLARLPFEYDCDSEFDIGAARRKNYFRIALLVPLCGSAGLWSPSCIASAQVAVDELNRRDGIDGRPIQLIMIDAALEAPNPIEETINELIEAKAIDAIVGMHISAVRQRLAKVVRQRIPYIYTPLYEGGEATPGIFAIGETPSAQLGPAIDFLHSTYRIRRWALIGNDYVWPRVSHAFAKQRITELGAALVYERYLPFGLVNMRKFIAEIEQSQADAALISLVGQDAIMFNRAFGHMAMHRKIVRLSCAIEENGLAACGPAALERLYSSSSYFNVLPTDANAAFREKYHNLHGDNAPLLNTLGQSIYEGVQFLASLMAAHRHDWCNVGAVQMHSISYTSARRPQKPAPAQTAPIYLARANGIQFEIVKRL